MVRQPATCGKAMLPGRAARAASASWCRPTIEVGACGRRGVLIAQTQCCGVWRLRPPLWVLSHVCCQGGVRRCDCAACVAACVRVCLCAACALCVAFAHTWLCVRPRHGVVRWAAPAEAAARRGGRPMSVSVVAAAALAAGSRRVAAAPCAAPTDTPPWLPTALPAATAWACAMLRAKVSWCGCRLGCPVDGVVNVLAQVGRRRAQCCAAATVMGVTGTARLAAAV